MQTTSQMILRALRRIEVVASDEPATADQSAAGLDALNEIAQSFRLHGVMYDMPILTDGAEIPLPDACIAPFQTVLAARLAEDYGRPGPNASDAWSMLAAHFYVVPEMSLYDLTRTDSQAERRPGFMIAGLTGTGRAPSVWNDSGKWID